MVQRNEKVFAEVYGILAILGDNYIKRLPRKLYQLIDNSRDSNYLPKYTLNKPFHEQGVHKKSISMIALLHLNYWCNSEEEKNELRKILNRNETNLQEELRAKYNPENIFKKNQTYLENSVAMIEFKKEKKIHKIINFIKKFFKLNIKK